MRPRGIEPLAKPWKGFMLPLHHERYCCLPPEISKYTIIGKIRRTKEFQEFTSFQHKTIKRFDKNFYSQFSPCTKELGMQKVEL